ncbi:hypothetical protein L6452_01160 [Arctium lappa]|uniref:Uncharacterized protein n=1 Tax=Arctium lappa TaxID=4217 RepID=A0ACB9FFY5_ARCLA|nr:hypothetical protein L6452_01160 [Arctium lappa]
MIIIRSPIQSFLSFFLNYCENKYKPIRGQQSTPAVEGIDPVRREKLIDLLDIDLQWRMHKVSDGDEEIFLLQVLLLDEVTVDLDVVARMDLLEFFKEECEQRGATIVYATHIFDGLKSWTTDLAYIQDGELKRYKKLVDLPEMKNSSNLLSVVHKTSIIVDAAKYIEELKEKVERLHEDATSSSEHNSLPMVWIAQHRQEPIPEDICYPDTVRVDMLGMSLLLYL